MNQVTEKYLKVADRIPGWFEPCMCFVLAILDEIQERNGITGSIGEIGVYFGKSFFPIAALAKPDESIIAVDAFNNDLNISKSGVFDEDLGRREFEEWCSKILGRKHEVKIIQSVSGSLTHNDYMKISGNKFRIWSIDGGHSAEETEYDIAQCLMSCTDGALLIIDDIFSFEWLGVNEAVNWFLSHELIIPVVRYGSRIVFTNRKAHIYTEPLKEKYKSAKIATWYKKEVVVLKD